MELPKYDFSKTEEYLNYLIGSSDTYPQDVPNSRLEAYLKYLCEHPTHKEMHVINVTHTTGSGTWHYQAQLICVPGTKFYQTGHIAKYLYDIKPNMRIPATGTYLDKGSNTLYHVEAIIATSENQVTVEIYKATDGSQHTIATGAVEVDDIII